MTAEPPPLPSVVVAAFEPFEGRAENRALAALRRLEAAGLPASVATAVLPVAFAELPSLVPALLARARRALVLVGESGEASRARIERVAVNLIDARVEDNAGARPIDVPVVPGGPGAYFATWPARALCEAARAAGCDVELSAHAGTFACNAALYLALHAEEVARPAGAAERAIGFLHVPANPPFANDEAAGRLLRLLVGALA